jgi:hypothetical protein
MCHLLLRTRATRALSLLALALVVFGCDDGGKNPNAANGASGMSGGMAGESGGAGGVGGGGAGGEAGSIGPVTQAPGEFVSADPNPNEHAGFNVGAGGAGGMSAAGGAGGTGGAGAQVDDPREVVEGDIYRVLDAGTLLNLNAYRGVQVIDVSDPSAPTIIGRFPVIGSPIEMYVRGTTAFVLLNDWQGYYGTREDVQVERKQGGLVVKLDISDRTAPRELDRQLVQGSIRTSRVVQNDTVASLYIASSHEAVDASGAWSSKTVVTSFDIAEGLAKKSELDLGGYVSDIQATPTELLVANQHWNTTSGNAAHTVSVVDISDPSGAMVLGDTVVTRGPVQSQFNMDMHNGVLRVVSSSWDSSTNHVETFAAQDLTSITPLHSCTFGDGQQLYATLFLGNKAFFVTYLRQDPFHAFAIGDDGSCEERSEYVVSGWNDFFRPVAGETRLIGIGVDDADATVRPAISLYDITDLDNANPLLARASAQAISGSWSEAQYDHRASSVLEDAVSVEANDGATETGLVLLPFEGYDNSDQDGGRYRSGVALFTFSDRTVTQRGTLSHDSPVRRTFTTDDTTIANLSELSLSLYDHSDPTNPEPLGTLELASDYRRVLRFGDYVARVRRGFSGWYYAGTYGESDTVELVPADADLNYAQPVAELEVPSHAKLLKAGDRLITVTQESTGAVRPDGTSAFDTDVTIFDLSDPTAPRKAGTATTDDLVPTYFGYGYGYGYPGYWGGGSYVGCGMGMGWFDGSQADGVFALGDRVVFVDARGEAEAIGSVRNCHYEGTFDNCDGVNCQQVVEGWLDCSSTNGGAEECSGDLRRCDVVNAEFDCHPVQPAEVRDQLFESCTEYETFRGWSRYAFKALDIRNPDAPVFGELVSMPRTEEGVSVLPDGDSLYYTYQVPVRVEDDARRYVSYYYKQLAFDDVAALEVEPAVNIPGQLIAANDSRLYTKDLRWGTQGAQGTATDAYLHELSVADGRARIEASHAFTGRDISKLAVDDGRIYVTTTEIHDGVSAEYDPVTKLALLRADGLALENELDVDSWATLEAVHQDRALFSVGGGLLMMNVEDVTAPYAQAFFNSNGWPEQILFEEGEILISAGMYGIYRFDADDSNLLSED